MAEKGNRRLRWREELYISNKLHLLVRVNQNIFTIMELQVVNANNFDRQTVRLLFSDLILGNSETTT
ncbi:hypothetical protein KFK09_022244 [Dendrobium nobile]|uniref:Uncharacterized protein n=1 Tax=Dendrobium nobile TaxID=94219 RepID=A0A8T3AI11_DENNO|nr:hypothetical protein KFK09_022244 [Dendrobium nobile]